MTDWKLYKGMRVVHCQQGDATWFNARLGHVTSSDVIRAIKERKRGTGPLAERERYKRELLLESLTGVPTEHYVSPAMDFGREYEPMARAEYEMAKGVDLELVGYVLHPRLPRCGASPDALVGEDGLVELKVPNADTHLEYIIDDVVPDEYVPQMMWQMACTGRQWCDFVSFQPPERNFDERLSMFIKKLARDDSYIAEMEAKVQQFLVEVNAMAENLGRSLEDQLRASIARIPHSMGPEAAEIPDFA